MAEKILEINSVSSSEVKNTVIWYPIVIGKNGSTGLIAYIQGKAIRGNNVEILGDGNIFRNLLYVGQVVDVISKSIEMEAELNNFEIFDIGRSNSMRINEIVDLIISVVGSSSRIVSLTSKLLHDFDAFIDVSKANRVSSQKPVTTRQSILYFLKEMGHEV